MQYMSTSHGYRTMGGIEYDGGGLYGEDKKGESITSMRLINRLWRWPSVDVNVRSRDCQTTDALRAISVWNRYMTTMWVCIQLSCSWRPRAFEEAHHRNIQAKFYNENSHQYMKVITQWDSLYEEHGATLKHRCGKRIVTLSLLSFSLFFLFGPSFYGLFFFFYRPGSHPDLWRNHSLHHPFLTGTML